MTALHSDARSRGTHGNVVGESFIQPSNIVWETSVHRADPLWKKRMKREWLLGVGAASLVSIAANVAGCDDTSGSDEGGASSSSFTGATGSADSTGSTSVTTSAAGGEGGGGPTETPLYAAQNPGPGVGVPHFVVTKVVPERDVCITISVEGVGGSGRLQISGNAPWTVGSVVIAQDASQCGSNAWPGERGKVAATAAAGTLLVEAVNRVCDVDVHVVVEFPTDPPWLPTEEAFDVDDLPVTGGCE